MVITDVASEYLSSTLETSEAPSIMLQIREIFMLPGIFHHGVADGPGFDCPDSAGCEERYRTWKCEIIDLIGVLFAMLPTIRLMFELDLAMSKLSPALDEREMLLLREESEDLPHFEFELVTKLLKLDLQLIVAMQESLKDTEYVRV